MIIVVLDFVVFLRIWCISNGSDDLVFSFYKCVKNLGYLVNEFIRVLSSFDGF